MSESQRAGQGILGQYEFTAVPFDIVHIDHVGPLPMTKEGSKYILSIIDRATNYIILIPVPDVTAETTARALYDKVFCVHGVPVSVVSDRHRAFDSKEVDKKLAQIVGVDWRFVAAENSQGNGMIERVHRTLRATLVAYCAEKQNKWENYLQSVCFAANTAPVFSKKGFTPSQLVYGKRLRKPLDVGTREIVHNTVGDGWTERVHF